MYKYEFYKDGKFKVTGGIAGESVNGYYDQVGTDVYLQVGGFKWTGQFDGTVFTTEGDERPHYPGFYQEEIKRITMLGDDQDLDWAMTRQGFVIQTPGEKRCDYAFVFKIERYHHAPID